MSHHFKQLDCLLISMCPGAPLSGKLRKTLDPTYLARSRDEVDEPLTD